jgi:hypothetical protein
VSTRPDTGWLASAEARLDRIGLALMSWWAWPLAMGIAAVAVIAVSAALVPTGDPQQPVLLLGHPPTPPCPSLVATGRPCGQCGMTRSWLWAVRGDFGLALRHNPAGLAAWLWIVTAGALGGARLVRRDPRWLRVPPWGVAVLAVAWLALYAGATAMRSVGGNPLP